MAESIAKFAVYGNYIYYDGRIEYNKYLVVENGIILDIIDKVTDNSINCIKRENSAIFPGFINTHTHIPMVFFRGLADDMPLMDWLKYHIWPAESKWLSDEFVYDATLLAACELIHSGTTTINDMYFYSHKIAEAMIKSGLKSTIGIGVLDFPTKFAKNIDDYLSQINILNKTINGNGLTKIAICPHSFYTVCPDNFLKCVSFAKKYDLLLHTHLSETEYEIKEIQKRYGKRPIELASELGLFDVKSIFAHCVHLTDEEIEILGTKKANISHCLESNLKLASGFSPVKKLIDAGANVSIGTDGAASNNDLDMLSEISTVAKFHKGLNMDPTVMDAKTVIDMSTINAARALSLSNTGILKKGFDADFFILSLDKAHLQPVYNILSHLVYTAKSSDITDLFIKGKWVMQNGNITTIDETTILKKAKNWSKKILKYN